MDQYFLEDIVDITKYSMEDSSPYARSLKLKNNVAKQHMKGREYDNLTDPISNLDVELLLCGNDEFQPASDATRDEDLSVRQFLYRYKGKNTILLFLCCVYLSVS